MFSSGPTPATSPASWYSASASAFALGSPRYACSIRHSGSAHSFGAPGNNSCASSNATCGVPAARVIGGASSISRVVAGAGAGGDAHAGADVATAGKARIRSIMDEIGRAATPASQPLPVQGWPRRGAGEVVVAGDLELD